MIITWNEKKNLQNKKKHRVSFETAQLVFDDPLHSSFQDRHGGGEERWRTMGLIENAVVLLVAHTYMEQGGEETIRIISARKATKKERVYMKKENKKQAREIRRLAKMREGKIDTTGIPEVAPTSPALVGKFYRPIKQSITVRLDADVIAWLKSSGRGYQTRTNKMLRSLMERQHQANKKGG